jgi:hypothetical protein
MKTLMKIILLFSAILFNAVFLHGQQVNDLPPGKYETRIQDFKWEKGDIELLDNSRYRISSSNETGDYRFSVTAQRVFFTSGPLKGIYAKTQLVNNSPGIFIPLNENQQLGFKLATGDIVGKLRN